MKVRADVDNKFIRRFLFIAIGCFVFMLWGLYDGLYTNPLELERAIAYKELSKKVESGQMTESEKDEQWKSLVNERGWALAKPKSPEVAQNYVYFQWFVFALGLILGVFFLIKYFKLLNSWMEADDKTVTTSWGESLQLDRVTGIDKRKWEKKGIAKVSFTDESGRARTMIFDDFKYHRESMAEIMKRAEKHVPADKIIGGATPPQNVSQEEPAEDTANVSE